MRKTGYALLRELTRGDLALNRDVTRVMNRLKAVYKKLGYPLHGAASVCTALSLRVARQDH